MANKKLTDIFSQLKSSIVGTKTAKVDDALDKAVKDIVSYKAHSGRQGYIDLVKTVIAKSTVGTSFGGSGLYSQSQSGPASMGQGARLMRYKTYDAIISTINYAYRALSVLTDNILSPDDITKISLDVKPKSFLEDKTPTESKVQRVKEVIKSLKLEANLDIIVKGTLGYGDFFCEIASAKIALTSKSMLSEGSVYQDRLAYQIKNGQRQVWETTERIKDSRKKTRSVKISIDYGAFLDEANDTKEQDSNKILNNLNLVFHKPNLVIKLQSSLYPVCFGYLVFPDAKGMNAMGSSLEDDSVNNICATILKKLEKQIPQMTEFKDNKELYDIIKHMVTQTDPSKALEIRYVPPDKMTHFKIPSSKFYPYGESIYDSSQYSAKVLIALETALAIQRLSRSTEKRKIAVEIGLPRDAQAAIEAMKEEFRKRKVSLDSFGTVDTIPCLDLNTQIRMANGFSMDLKEIIHQFQLGNKNLFVYSYDFETGKIIPNKIVNARVTGKNVDVLKVTLDNDTKVFCTPEHRWLLRDGTYKEAQDLKPNDSLMTDDLNNVSYKIEEVKLNLHKMDVGDIEVEKFHNFALECGVIIHNSMITTFEDVYIPQKDGKPFVDISTFSEGNVDVRSKIDELKFMRDQLTATWGVPPSFIGIEDGNNAKSALSEENILFARTVIGHQKYLSGQLTDLVAKVFSIISPDEALTLLDNVDIHLPTPKSLQYEREARYMNELVGLIESLERIGIPKEYSKKKYLSNFDWTEIKKYDIDQKVEKTLDPSKEDESDEFGSPGGGFGGASF